jgi:tetratricopeptide (TPR) repeat protein
MTTPVDPSASTAASLVAGTALGGPDQLTAWPALVRLVALLHDAATGDPALHAALTAVAAAPEDPGRVAALAHAVDARSGSDRGLRDELARLLDQAGQHPTAGRLVTQIAGHARVGKLVTIGSAGQVHLHLPPVPPPTVLDQLPPAHSGAAVSNLPPRNRVFTGRADLLDQLHQRLGPGQPAAVVQVQAQTLHGLGGVGKTQLALEYAHRHVGDYDLVWWVTAEPPAAIPGQLVAFARRLGLPEHPEQAETVQALWDALRQRDRWLLVFDNADDPADLRPWWPPGSGRVLVTSRNPTWGGLALTVAVDVLPRSDAVAFLQRRLGRNDPAFNQLADALGDLPLALEQAAAYLEETATSLSDYLGLLSERSRELLALGRPVTTEQTIATTWTVSLQRLREQAPAAEDLLSLCAFLAADDIPRDLPTQHPDVLPERLASVAQDPLSYQQTVGALRRYSLIRTSQDGQELSLHRLVQAVTRHQLDLDHASAWATVAVRLILAAFPHTPASVDLDAWPTSARLLPHVLATTDHANSLEIDPGTAADLLNHAGLYLWTRAEHKQARTLLERALDIREAHLGVEHPDTAFSLGSLGTVLRRLGDLSTARKFHERALAIREAQLGADHPDTAYTLNNLGNVLRDLGDLEGARERYQRSLAIWQAQLGPDHRAVATSLDNLGIALRNQGHFQAAREHHDRALRIWQAQLGPDHPDTATSLHNLGMVLRELGDLEDARTRQQRSLAIREARLGPEHPAVAQSLTGLGIVLRDLGDLDGARIQLERALTIYEARLGPDHPATAWSLDNLAVLLRDLGDLDRAHAMHERALAIREARLGPDHPATAQSLHNLARVLRDQGDLNGARSLYGRALALREARLGPDHPDTVRSRERLAAVVAQLENRE